jgi:hypothetical protein
VFADDKIHTPRNFNKNGTDTAKSELLTAVLTKIPVLRDKMSCGLASTPNHTASYNTKLEFFTTELF